MSGVLMIRHALSVWNVEGRWQGQADPPLSPEGEAQARAASDGLGDVDLLVTSDLERARCTGTLMAPGARHEIDPILREYDVGMWSGRTRAEIEDECGPELALFDTGRLDAPPGGERRADFDRRVKTAAARVAHLVEEAGAVNVLVVTHGGVVRALARLQGRGDRHVAHLAGYEAEVQAGSLSLLRPVGLLGVAAPGRGAVGQTVL